MRVAVLAFLQESNSFAPGVSTLADFADDLLIEGELVRTYFAAAHHEVGGFFAGLEEQGIEAVPVFAARAVPWGPIEATAFATLCERLLSALRDVGPVDGVLAAAHGATVSETIRDVDGYWLAAVRRLIGPEIPLIATLDPHANVSPEMVASCDALVAYRTNPHLDQRERGLEAAHLMGGTLRGEIRPCVAAAFPPLAIGIECQSTAEPPCADWLRRTAEVGSQPGILSASAILGFPYADVEEMGCAVLVVADGDRRLAEREAAALGRWVWERRQQFDRQAVPIAAAVAQVFELAAPICLLDIGDNIGGGGTADSTHLPHALLAAGAMPSLVCITDPQIVTKAQQVGVRGQFAGQVGGKLSPLSGPPLAGNFKVLSLPSGKFSEAQARHGGWVDFDQGPTAVLESDEGLTIIVNSLRTPPFSLAQITSCGLDPGDYRAIVAKGVHAPVAAYRDICRHLIRVDTPGVTSADMRRFDYRHRRSPMLPFERDIAWEPTAQ